MLRLRSPILNNRAGMTLIEMMVVVAIIAILGIIAVPNFLSYRNKSRVSSVIGTSETIRSSLASYAVNSPGNIYPLTDMVSDWDAFRAIINANGGSLKPTLVEMSIKDFVYTSDTGQTYFIQVTVSVPEEMPGHSLEVSPGGILKQ